MREKRTVVWERKGYRTEVGSAAAERIRARMRPNAVTRVTDWVFQCCDGAVEAIDRFEASLTQRVGGGVALSLMIMAAVFLLLGHPKDATRYFAGLGMIYIGWRAFATYHTRYRLPPVHARRRRDEARAVVEAIAGGSLLVIAQLVMFNAHRPGDTNGRALLMNASLGAFGLFRKRVDDEPSKPRRILLGWIILAIFIVSMMGFFLAISPEGFSDW